MARSSVVDGRGNRIDETSSDLAIERPKVEDRGSCIGSVVETGGQIDKAFAAGQELGIVMGFVSNGPIEARDRSGGAAGGGNSAQWRRLIAEENDAVFVPGAAAGEFNVAQDYGQPPGEVNPLELSIRIER